MKHTKEEYKDAIMNNKSHFENGDSCSLYIFTSLVLEWARDLDHVMCNDASEHITDMLTGNDRCEGDGACKLRLFDCFYEELIKGYLWLNL